MAQRVTFYIDGFNFYYGRRLTSKPTQKGVYIHNGKKIAVKM